LTRRSVREFTREARREPGITWFEWLHGYVYARWVYLYIDIANDGSKAARPLGKLVRAILRLLPAQPGRKRPVDWTGVADDYHGKVLRPDAAKKLVMVEEEIDLRNLEQVIPYAEARDIVLRNPDHIVALECPCRASRTDPCLPLDVCLVVGEPFAGLVADHHPRRSRWITQEEAAEILRAEHERGHVHHAFFKDAMLDRFYAICNCCDCCCGAIEAWRNGTPMLASSGYVARVDGQACIGCGTCADSCVFDAVATDTGVAVVDESICLGCGVCVSTCDQEAISLVRDPTKGEPLEIDKLVAHYATETGS